VKEWRHSTGLPVVVPSHDRALVPQVLRDLALNRLTLADHSLLKPGDQAEVNPLQDAVGCGDVGRAEIQIDTSVNTRCVDRMGNSEVEEEGRGCQCEPESPARGLAVLSEERTPDVAQVDLDVHADSEQYGEPACVWIPSEQVVEEACFQSASTGQDALESLEADRILATSSAERAVPGAEYRGGFVGSGHRPGRGKVRVSTSEGRVRAFSGVEPGLLRVGTPIREKLIDCGANIQEDSDQCGLEEMRNDDSADGFGGALVHRRSSTGIVDGNKNSPRPLNDERCRRRQKVRKVQN